MPKLNGGEKTRRKETEVVPDAYKQYGDVIRLPKGDRFIGLLTDVIKPAGEDFVLALIEESMVQVPKELAPELWALLGQRTIIGNIPHTGWRVGAHTDPKPTFQRILGELLA
jgi:hypothetical protein